jgi:penicillin V acylase-like amidase (Ntn superfamily)
MKKSAFFLILLAGSIASFACTTFCLNDNGHYYFGRNYDWITGNGMVMTNARYVKKASATTGSQIAWVSQYGSITFNQYGKEFPTGGMNEKGLVVELMWLDETRYPAEDSRPALGVLQWLQYQLDNCQTVEEVIASDKKIRISAKATPLHYLIADASGKAATIEFLDGKMVVHTNNELKFPVLANSVYAASIEKTESLVKGKKNISLPDNSLERFAKACSMIQSFEAKEGINALDYSFAILNNVAQGNYTKWSIVYDITDRKIHFITNVNKTRRTISFADLNFDCSSPSLAIDMNNYGSGDLSKGLKNLSFEDNKNLVETSVKESSSIISITDAQVKETVDFFNKISCQKKE